MLREDLVLFSCFANLVFSVRTVSYGSSFFPFRFMARALRAWAINREGKNSVRNLQYGPRTRLVRGMYFETGIKNTYKSSTMILLLIYFTT